MTAEPSPSAEAPNESQSRSSTSAKSLARRALGWLWQGDALARLEAKHRLRAPRTAELRRRAKLCIELGRHAFDPPQPFESGSARAEACELYRQAIYWALLARQARAQVGSETADAASSEQSVADPVAVWASADRAALTSMFKEANVATWVDEALAAKSFADLAELPDKRLEALAEGLRTFAESLLADFEAAQREIERFHVRRFLRLSLVAAALVALGVGVMKLKDSREQGRNVASGKPWRASSRYGESGCRSPLQECPKGANYFFHTNDEQDPWLEIDLEEARQISGVAVANRVDCCTERAVPLVVSVSSDHERWTEVSRHTTDFKTWDSSFAPVDARWVRVQVLGRAILHLHEVQVLR